jgi:hypothetical protein
VQLVLRRRDNLAPASLSHQSAGFELALPGKSESRFLGATASTEARQIFTYFRTCPPTHGLEILNAFQILLQCDF